MVREDVSLARALSKLGWCSRAEGRVLVEAGRVVVDGAVVRNPDQRVDVRRAHITVDGKTVRAQSNIYIMMHKPRGWVTTTSDEHGRSTVYELLPDDLPRVVAVGRLDLESEGLLLFTNDTRWADRMLDPASHVDKVYQVQVRGAVTDQMMEQALAGVDAGRGEVLSVKGIRALPRKRWLEIVLDEGRNRHVRRVLEAVGLDVERLVRVSIGPLRLGDLTVGMTRPLTREEKQALDDAVTGKAASATKNGAQGGGEPSE